MKQKLWITLVTYLAYCIDKELYKAIDYLREQVRVLVEQQEKQNKRILLTNRQRMRVAAKAKRLSRKMLEQCTVLFTPDTVLRCTIFFVIELSTRKVFFAPIKLQPDGDYMKQIARVLTDYENGFLNSKKYLIHDRGPLYKTKEFHQILISSGIKPVKLPPRSPDLNPYAESFVKSVKSECLNYLILSSVEQLEYVLKNYCDYYHHERIHQSLGRIIEPIHRIDNSAEIACIERLGVLLKSYHRLAA